MLDRSPNNYSPELRGGGALSRDPGAEPAGAARAAALCSRSRALRPCAAGPGRWGPVQQVQGAGALCSRSRALGHTQGLLLLSSDARGMQQKSTLRDPEVRHADLGIRTDTDVRERRRCAQWEKRDKKRKQERT